MENSNEVPQVWKDWRKIDLGCLKERWVPDECIRLDGQIEANLNGKNRP